MEGLKPGRIVYFVFDEQSAAEVMRRRTDGKAIAERMSRTPPAWPTGAMAHVGNAVQAGDIFPAMIIRVWDQSSGSSNLKVMLDGSDTYWATSVVCADDKRHRSWHWMFEGQAERYQPDRAVSVPDPFFTGSQI